MMNITLLAAQAALADTLAGGNPTLTPVSGEAQMNLWDMAVKGGWIMLVLALLSVACFYIFFERLAYIRKAGKEDPLFMERIRDYIRTGEVKSAINYCRITNTPSAPTHHQWPARTSQNHKAPQPHPSVLSGSSRHRTPASASSDHRRASGVYMLFSLP